MTVPGTPCGIAPADPITTQTSIRMMISAWSTICAAEIPMPVWSLSGSNSASAVTPAPFPVFTISSENRGSWLYILLTQSTSLSPMKRWIIPDSGSRLMWNGGIWGAQHLFLRSVYRSSGEGLSCTIECIQTDNGTEFTFRFISLSPFVPPPAAFSTPFPVWNFTFWAVF